MWQTLTTEAQEVERNWLIIPLLGELFQSTVVPKSLFEIYPLQLSSQLCFLVKLASLLTQQLEFAFSSFLPHVPFLLTFAVLRCHHLNFSSGSVFWGTWAKSN